MYNLKKVFEHKVCCATGCNRQGIPTGKVRKKDGLWTRQKRCFVHKEIHYLRGRWIEMAYREENPNCEKCGFIAKDLCQIDVDHIDGNHNNRKKENLQSLCKNCHALKTAQQKDNLNRYAA